MQNMQVPDFKISIVVVDSQEKNLPVQMGVFQQGGGTECKQKRPCTMGSGGRIQHVGSAELSA